jgi:membrane protein YdbS with pleckstrin-like domain
MNPGMAFTNLQIDTSTLPRAEDLQMQPMAAVYQREALTQLLLIFAPALVLSLAPQLIPNITAFHRIMLLLIPLTVLIIGGLAVLLVMKQIKVKGYALRDHDIAYRSGLFWRKTTVLLFSRVQHVEVTSGPLQRRFGLASLKFFTAGGSSVDLKIEGLLRADAEKLREFILLRGAGEHES